MADQLVSIVTPAYNAEAFLPSSIDSVLGQIYSEWEWHIVDDCSTDRTRELVQARACGDRRIKLIALPQNSGPAMARQAGVQSAKGRYVAFLDSDDLWLPHKLAHQLRFMAERNAGLSFTAFRRVSGDGRKLGRVIHPPARLSYQQLLGNTAIVTSTAVVDRALVGTFHMVKTYYDDFALWLEITRRGFPAYGLDEDLVRYRVVGGSVSRNKLRSARMVWRTYREVERLGILRSSFCFARYAFNAARKYRSF
jgi:teichuronic acid biosynthesis glycosyltransferase TuaG